MTVNRHLYFLSEIGREKFIYQNSESCPFCNREEFSDIIAEEETILLLKNKFTTLANTFQTVLIETNDCSANIATYDTPHMRKIITFGINHWLTMEESGDFKSVVFLKIMDLYPVAVSIMPHMQIIGLKDIDYKLNLKDDIFAGIEIYKEGKSLLNISTKPNACSTEFNIITTPRHDNFMADNIQNIVNYILILMKCSSFNLFFYQWKKRLSVK